MPPGALTVWAELERRRVRLGPRLEQIDLKSIFDRGERALLDSWSKRGRVVEHQGLKFRVTASTFGLRLTYRGKLIARRYGLIGDSL